MSLVLSAFSSAAQAKGTGAKASFTSYKSISSIFKLATDRALCDAGIGPVNMYTGSSPTTEIDTISALGFTLIFLSPASLQTRTAAAPSVIWLALPAVTTPPSETVLSPASFSRLASNLIPSSAVTISSIPSAFLAWTGRISLSKYFNSVAFAAF